jgi:endogenous inhibitor of DNA gyrase (YacG/DUF329 family)
MEAEIVVFNGFKFRRYPHSKAWSDRNYFKCAKLMRQGLTCLLHRAIWESVNGKIGDGFHIHHKDENPLNNSIDNLVRMPKADHSKHHGLKIPEWKRKWLKNRVKQIRPMTKEWHKTDEGKLLHSQNGKMVWAEARRVACKCANCGKEYERWSINTQSRFCSNYCKTKFRLKSGIDNESRICPHCGTSFECNRYFKTMFCSRSCANKSR